MLRRVILFAALAGLVNIFVVKGWNISLGFPNKHFVVGDRLGRGVTGEMDFMPVALLAEHLAPAGREGTVYDIAVSILNVAWACSEMISGLFCDLLNTSDGEYANHSVSMLMVAIAALASLLFLRFVPDLSHSNIEAVPVECDRSNRIHNERQVEDDERSHTTRTEDASTLLDRFTTLPAP
jgi:hypothetical protein